MKRTTERVGGPQTEKKPGAKSVGMVAAVLLILVCCAMASLRGLPPWRKHFDEAALASASAATAAPASGEHISRQNQVDAAHTPQCGENPTLSDPGIVSYEDLSGLLSRSAVLFSDSQKMLLKGEWADLPAGPVIKDGILYVPVQNVFEYLGASVTKINDILYINCNGVVSALMEKYNVALVNTDSLIMEAAPVISGDVCYIPADAAGKVLNTPSYHSVTQRMLILGGPASEFTEEGCEAIKRHWGMPVNPMPESNEIHELTGRSGCDYRTLCSAAQTGRLYVGDNQGGISSWKMNEYGDLIKEDIGLSAPFEKNCVLIAGAGGSENRLYENRNGEWFEVSPLPYEIWSKEVQEAIESFFFIKAAIDIEKRRDLREALEACREAAVNDLTDPLYIKIAKTGAVIDPVSPPASISVSEERWNVLCQSAEPGDFLLFRCPGAGTEYGYFNHSSLILDVDRAGNTIHLLQARGAEYGVGADDSMDYLSFKSFYKEDYWMETDTAVLCEGIGLKDVERGSMTTWAYEKFNGYQFGYGSWQGIEETNCAELIRHVYFEYGIQLVSEDGASRLKELLEGNARNLVVLPDDLLLSDTVLLKAVWQRQPETGMPDGG